MDVVEMLLLFGLRVTRRPAGGRERRDTDFPEVLAVAHAGFTTPTDCRSTCRGPSRRAPTWSGPSCSTTG